MKFNSFHRQAHLVGNKVAETVQNEDTKKFGREVVAPFFMCNLILFERSVI